MTCIEGKPNHTGNILQSRNIPLQIGFIVEYKNIQRRRTQTKWDTIGQ